MHEIGADWAAQRIKTHYLKQLLILKLNKSDEIITTLIDEFKYPKYGPGMMGRVQNLNSKKS